MADYSGLLEFGGGVSSRATEDDIEVQECALGENFNLDPKNVDFVNRKPFDLMCQAPNGAEIRGFATLRKADGSVSLLVQAGSVVYEWDGLCPSESFCSMSTDDLPTYLWLMDETSGTTLVDSIAANNGAISGTTTGKFEMPGAVGCSAASIDFDGLEALLTTQPAGTVGSFEMWVYKTVAGNTVLIDKRNTAGTGYRLRIAITAASEVELYAWLDGGDGSQSRTATTVNTLTMNAWSYIVVTSDGTNWNILVNGVDEAFTTALDSTGGTPPAEGSWFDFVAGSPTTEIGLTSRTDSVYFDQVAIYPTVITPARALEKYNA